MGSAGDRERERETTIITIFTIEVRRRR